MNAEDLKIKNEDVVVTSNTVISGGITSDSNIYIFGEVKGDVVTSQNVIVDGRVEGAIKAGNLQLLSGTIQGDVVVSDSVEIVEDAYLLGDLQSTNLNSEGIIKGNLNISKLTTLGVTAVCEGDIISALLNIKTGAKLTGGITIYDDSEDQSIETNK